MNRRRFLYSSLAPLGAAATLPLPVLGQVSEGKADRILFGRVRPMDTPGRLAEAVAIQGERILMAGTREEVLSLKGSSTVVRDLGNAGIIPGFNDAHAHLEREGLKTLRPSLEGAKSVPEVLARIAQLAKTTPRGEWIVTMPVGEGPFYFGGPDQLVEKRMPTRQELDAAAPNNPVCILAPFGYWGTPPTYTALNSEALKRNGIEPGTKPHVSDVEIFFDASGEPTGVIANKRSIPAMEFDLLPAVPRFTPEERITALKRAQSLYHAKGTTSTFEGHGEAPISIGVYRQLWEQGDLTMRVGFCVSPSWSSLAEAERDMRDWLAYARGRGLGDPKLRISGIFINNGGDPAVAELARNRLPDVGWSGQIEQASTPKEFEELCMLAARYDLRAHILGGNRAESLAMLARVNEKYPLAVRRWVVQHISGLSVEELKEIRRLGLTATLIPAGTLWKGGSRSLEADEATASLLCPARQLIDLGVPVAAGTDNIPYDPLFTMWVLCNRQERTTNRVLGPSVRLSNEEALRLLTSAGAWLTFDEQEKGLLKAGYYADLAVLSSDPITAPAAELRELRCTAAMVGGRVVHGEI